MERTGYREYCALRCLQPNSAKNFSDYANTIIRDIVLPDFSSCVQYSFMNYPSELIENMRTFFNIIIAKYDYNGLRDNYFDIRDYFTSYSSELRSYGGLESTKTWTIPAKEFSVLSQKVLELIEFDEFEEIQTLIEPMFRDMPEIGSVVNSLIDEFIGVFVTS